MPVYPSEKAQKTSSIENEWVKVKLGDCLIDHKQGKKHKKGKKPKHLSQKYSEGVLPYATAEYFRTCKAVDFVPVDYLDSCVHIKKDDLIIIWDGSNAGEVFVGREESVLASTMALLEVNKTLLDTKFCYFFLKADFNILNDYVTGSTIPHVSSNILTNLEIPIPPLPEQRRISALLGSIEKAISLERRCEESLTTIKRAAMHVVFNPANKVGWEKIKLGEILKLEYGKPLPKEDRCNHGGFPAFGANGILCWSKKAYRNEPSIIVGRKGSAGEVNLTNGPFYPTDVTFFVVHNEKKALLKYLYYLLIQLNLKRLVQGIKPGINRNDVYALNTYIPPLHEQQEIVDFLTTLDQKLDIHRRKRACLENIFRLFLHNLTRGTLRFTDLPEGCF
ncbi:MAG: restriction endonuclease subunit S [Acetobacter sp.]|nr:restriction endonuclease subunit S [Acetobacter sp.]